MITSFRILALDLGSTTGWAFLDPSKESLEFGSYQFDGTRAQKLMQFRNTLDTLLHLYRPEIVVYERPFCRGLSATRMLWGMAGIAEALGYGFPAAVLDQLPGPIKRRATGKGNADKEAMITAAKELGHNVASDHEADAVLLALYTNETVRRTDA